MTIQKLPGTAITANSIPSTAISTTVELGGPRITAVQVTNNSYTILDDTAVDTAGGYLKITGSGFVTGCTVLIGTVLATSVSFVSGTELNVQIPAQAAGTYVIYITNPNGGTAIRALGVTYSATPAWTTASTLTTQAADIPISIQLSANSNSTVSYTLQSGSTLPAGLTLSNVGLLSGTVTGLSVDTGYSFTVVATDAELQDSPRTFTVTITAIPQIARSLRFNSADSANLSRTPSAASNRRTYTWSGWYKQTAIADNVLFNAQANSSSGTQRTFISINSSGTLFINTDNLNTAFIWAVYASGLYRDVSAWYHIVVAVDTTLGVTNNRVKIYVNGVDVTNTSAGTFPSQNYDDAINNAVAHYVGYEQHPAQPTKRLNGYLAEVNFIDGSVLTPSSFGRIDSNTGTWVPVRYTGSYGTNGFYLNFSDNSNTTATTLGKDSSGNNNNWTPNNFSVAAGSGNDSLVDSPTSYGTDTGLGGEVRGNYCTLNLLKYSGVAPTITDGSLQSVISTDGTVFGTIAVSSGKWYWETVMTVGAANLACFGIAGINTTQAYFANSGTDTGYGYAGTGVKTTNGTPVSYGSTFTVGDVIGAALDLDAGTIAFYKNGVSQGTAYTGISGTFYPAGANGNSSSTKTLVFNFGQRPFAYTAPSGFKALCTHNLPTTTIGFGSDQQANDYFDTVLYTGNGTSQTVTGLQFKPDFVWIKRRDSNWSNAVYDSIRGAGSLKALSTNGTDAEGVFNADTTYGYLSSFNSNGFTVINGTIGGYTNLNNATYVAWCWRAGGNAVVNTAGTIQSNVSVNTTAGFSIVSWTGNGLSNQTIAHGLAATPAFLIAKRRDGSTGSWRVWHKGLSGTTYYLGLEQQTAQATSSTVFNGQSSTTFTVGNDPSVNNTGTTYIAYCWTDIPGFSAFGSYTGNASTDGPFVYLGFRPKFILIKNASASGYWNLQDSARNTVNPADLSLFPNVSDAEQSGSGYYVDFLSNGFKLRTLATTSHMNGSGNTIIYAAFAESPFKTARSR